MFMKKKNLPDKQILCRISEFLEQKALNWNTAGQVLDQTCKVLGEEVDCFVSITIKERNNYQYTTLPEDEARYYINVDTKIQEQRHRISGRTAHQMVLDVENILEGIWIFEVAEHVSEEEISVYFGIASELKYFLYSCVLAQENEKEEKTDCFTGLPACQLFEENLKKKLYRKEPGFLIVIRNLKELPKPYRKDGISFYLIKMAQVCAAVHPDGLYCIGPDMVAIICREEKERVFSLFQELMQKLPESTFFLIHLSRLDLENIYVQIQQGIDATDQREFVSGDGRVFPRLPFFQEDE